ncbi:MAG: MFS transporter [Betaproteobacteria bacterium]|nr:MFS transporter [Betaproteobacteria bacterium]
MTQHSPSSLPRAHEATRLPASIYFVGAVSLFNDIATDLVTPLIPFLLASLGAGGLALGLVEGVSNAVSSLLRLWAGRFSDASGGQRKPLVLGGYVVSNLARPLLAIATSAWQVAWIRAFDRVGKGIRSAPRDALIVDLAPPALRARAFGVQTAMDNFGAVLGALLGVLLVGVWMWDLKTVILVSAIPGLLSVLMLAFLVPEPPKHHGLQTAAPRLQWTGVSRRMRGFLIVTMLFTFARVAELFVVLRAHELGGSIAHGLLLWAAFNVMRVGVSYAAGILADRHGKLALVVPGWAVFAVALFLFSLVQDLPSLWAGALFLGAAMAVSEGVERSIIGDHAHAGERGTLFGWYHMLVGVASIPAGLALGWLWQVQGAAIACIYSGCIALAAAMILHWRVAPALRVRGPA